jgi:uncharacterized membrane protein/nitrite reductase/ring-hydroxylating ferredoxin subunit
MRMLKNLLQGKPLGHPLHPALVHFPIGLFIFSLLLDLGGLLFPAQPGLYRGAYYALGFGIGMALLAAAAGLPDWWDIRLDHPAKKKATTHMLLNLGAVVIFTASFILRLLRPDLDIPPPGYLFLSILGLGLVLVSGYLGGVIVYDDGIGAGRHRRVTPTPRQTICVSADQAEDGWIPVVDAEAVAEGETLRVDLDGLVLALVKLEGQFYAFQEFCTHRFGPLSEGSIHEYQVECPWHRSCFDVRSGKVTEGPAKVDLKTHPVSIRAGKAALAASPQNE